MNAHVAQVGAALVAATTPWMVARIAYAVASNHAGPSGPVVPLGRSYRLLAQATLLTGSVVGASAVLLPAPSPWMAVIDALAFAGLALLGLRALGDFDRDTRASRHIESTTRTASLVVRRHRDYLAASWRILLFGVTTMGIALFAWRATLPSSVERRPFVPVAFSLIALVFLWLYEVWIHALVVGPIVPDSPESNQTRRRSIQRVFATGFLLVTSFLTLAHTLLNLDWAAPNWWAAAATVAGGGIGVIGCALALSAELGTSRYEVVPR